MFASCRPASRALPHAQGAGLDGFGRSRSESERVVGQVFEGFTLSVPDPVGSDPRATGLVVNVAATLATADMEDGPCFLNPDPVCLTVRAEGRKGCLPAVRALKLFHLLLP
jgi:hypothetical protein